MNSVSWTTKVYAFLCWFLAEVKFITDVSLLFRCVDVFYFFFFLSLVYSQKS